MKKFISYLLVSVLALGVGYVAGGLIAAKKATEEAYYSSILWLAAAKNELILGNKDKAETTLSLGITGSLNVIKTFDDHFQSGVFFIVPNSGFLFSQKEKDKILKTTEGPPACMIKNGKEPSQSP